MLVGWGSFEASDNNKNSANTNKNLSSVEFGQEKGPDAWSIILANNPDLMDLKEHHDIINEKFEKAVNDATLVELIQNYKNALDDAAAQDENVKKCLDAYSEAFYIKNKTISSIVSIIQASDRSPYLNPFDRLFYRSNKILLKLKYFAFLFYSQKLYHIYFKKSLNAYYVIYKFLLNNELYKYAS